jgi:hypothetical protein
MEPLRAGGMAQIVELKAPGSIPSTTKRKTHTSYIGSTWFYPGCARPSKTIPGFSFLVFYGDRVFL